jgi:hypothetical protein
MGDLSRGLAGDSDYYGKPLPLPEGASVIAEISIQGSNKSHLSSITHNDLLNREGVYPCDL